MKNKPLLACCMALLGMVYLPSAPAVATATGGAWAQLHPTASPPGMFPVPYGYTNVIAYDAANETTVLFRGDATWTFDGSTWTQQHPASMPPGSSVTNNMTYDAGTGTVILLQQLSSGTVATFSWDGSTWTDQHPAVEPPAGGEIVYDSARNRVIARIATGPSQAETWSYDGVTWAAQHPSTEAPQGYLVDDPSTRQVVSYEGNGVPFGTWTWDGVTWTQQHPATSPTPGCGINPGSYDGSQVIELDGCGSTWAWDGTGWTNLHPPASPQPTRSDYRLAYDGSRVILFGGLVSGRSTVALNDTWAWTSNAVARRPWTGGHDAVGVAHASTDAYFAEGYTGLNFVEYLTIQNPGPAQTLTVDYFNDSGRVITKQHGLGAGSRTTVIVNDDVGPGQAVGAHLHATNSFVAERPMYFSFGGLTGGHDVLGAQSLNTTFYFAEGYTGPGFAEFLTLLNPGAVAAAVNVTYYYNDGSAPNTVVHAIGATSRMTIHVNDPGEAGPGREVSVRVVSDRPVLAERPMYFDYFGETGGSVTIGSPTLMTEQNLAEGHVGQRFDEYLTLFNPDPSPVVASITYYLTSGAPQVQPLTLPANSRTTIHVNDVLPAGSDSSVHVHSSLPILVERPMYFNANGWTGGHDAMAVPDASVGIIQNFAEGFVGATFLEYYTIMNPDPVRTAHVVITYADQAGHTTPVAITIQPQARWTERVNADLAAGIANSATITSDVPILAERPMYFAY